MPSNARIVNPVRIPNIRLKVFKCENLGACFCNYLLANWLKKQLFSFGMNDAHDSQVLAELLKLPDAPLNLSQRRECCNSPLRTADGGLRTPMPISGKRTETNGASSVELRKTTRAKTFRERQKEEMARLRLDVENFTAHLALQRRPTVAEAPSVWGSIARRQCLETQRSQVENAKLHESLEACVAHINSLKTLLNEVKVRVFSA